MTPCQSHAWRLLQGKENIFLTGAAGTGKSFLVKKFLQNKGFARFPVTASTGVAAILVNGCTFHSFFGLGIMQEGTEATILRARKNRYVTRRIAQAEGIIIDEVSMLSGEVLRAAEAIARYAKDNNKPWGGLRIIIVGDFAQLPPISEYDAKDWAFLNEIWKLSNLRCAFLNTIVRTNEPRFIKVLNDVRQGIVSEDVQVFLKERTTEATEDFDGTRLFPRRVDVDTLNLRKLLALPGSEVRFETIYSGKEQFIAKLKKEAPIPELLLLKCGALVMLRKNDTSGLMRWVNGSLGHILNISQDYLHIELLTGEKIEIDPANFTQLDPDGHAVATARNFPVTLAWASTIHKSQGATIDRVMVDLSGLWDPGQAYVALSRVKSVDGLFIERWDPASILAEPLVMKFYKEIQVV